MCVKGSLIEKIINWELCIKNRRLMERTNKISKSRVNPYNISMEIYPIRARTCNIRNFFPYHINLYHLTYTTECWSILIKIPIFKILFISYFDHFLWLQLNSFCNPQVFYVASRNSQFIIISKLISDFKKTFSCTI